MFRMLSVIALPTALYIAATVPAEGATPSPTPIPARTPAPAPTPTQAENEAEIRNVLKAQQLAWNRGEIGRFMEGYWRSRDTTFISGGVVVCGWQTVHDRYKSRYSDPEKMGQ